MPKQTGRGFRQQEVDDPVLPDVVVALENRDQVRRKRLSDRPEKRGQGMGDGPVEVLNPRKKLRNDRLDAGPTKCHGPICSIHIELVRGHDLAKIHVQKASGSACGYPQDRSRARCGMRVRLSLSLELLTRPHTQDPSLGMSTARSEILEAIPAVQRSDGTFTLESIVRELRRRKSRYAEGTIRTHVVSRMCANARANHAVTYDDLEKVDTGVYRLI